MQMSETGAAVSVDKQQTPVPHDALLERIRIYWNEHIHDLELAKHPVGTLGFSMPKIWLIDDTQLAKASVLIDEYQRQRQGRAREDYQHRVATGQSRTLIDIFKEAPRWFMGYLLTIVIVIYFLSFYLSIRSKRMDV